MACFRIEQQDSVRKEYASIGCIAPEADPGDVLSQHQTVRTHAVVFSVMLFWIFVEAVQAANASDQFHRWDNVAEAFKNNCNIQVFWA